MSKPKILILNGPNLNLLGTREPEIYGHQTMEDYFLILKEAFPQVDLTYFQSNSEGVLIDKLQEVGFELDGIVFNAGGYTHTSVAIADAVSAITTPVVEVHISNPAAREVFRHHSYLSNVVVGSIAGFGVDSYRLGVLALLEKN